MEVLPTIMRRRGMRINVEWLLLCHFKEVMIIRAGGLVALKY